jgi:hypothetical protein
MGQDRVTNLLERNLQQEEEAARIAERSAEELLRKAQHAEEQEDQGLVEKAKDKLAGQ